MRARHWVTAAAALAGLLASLAGCTTEAAAPVLVVAADLELTGPGAARGAVQEQALRLRIGQVNRQRLLAGGRQMVLRVSDNRSDPQVAAANLAGHAADARVAALVAGGCLPCVTETVAAVEGVPTIALAAGPLVAEPVEQRRWIFQLAPNAADNANLIAAQLAADGVGSIVVVATDDAYGRAGAEALTQAAAFDGVELAAAHPLAAGADPEQIRQVVAVITNPTDGTDLSGPGAVPGVATPPGSPDSGQVAGVVLWTGPGDAAGLVAGLREAGWDGRFYLDTAAVDELFYTGHDLQGARLVATNTPVADALIAGSIPAAARKQWLAEYVAAYGTYHLAASLAADAVNVLVDATNRTTTSPQGRIDRTGLREAVETTRSLPGLTGLIRFSRDQHSGLHPNSLSILTAGNGRWQP